MTDDIALRARRRTRAVVAVASTVLLVVAATVTGLVVVLGNQGAHASRPTRPIATAAGNPIDTDLGPSSAAPVPTAAAGLSWVTVAGAGVPISRDAGPSVEKDGRAHGFARTPLGAVLAAAHISVRLSPQAGPAVFESTLRQQVVGPDAAALDEQLEESYQQARAQLGLPYGVPAGRLYSTIRGYRVDVDSTDRPTVRLLIEGPGANGGSVLVALVADLQWVDDDWALVAPTGGDWSTATSLVTDSTGYTRFSDGG